MSFGKFCPKCGQPTEALVSGVCQNCFLEKHDLFEMRDFDMPTCVICGKLQIKGMWRGYSEQDIKEELGAKVKLNHDLDKPMIDVELVKIEPFEYDTIVKVKGFINDALLEQEKGFKFKLQKVSCDACMKLSSNYREAVIQLRAYDNKETDEMLKLAQTMIEKEKLHDSLSGIVKTVKVKTGGYDIWVGSKKASKKVVRYMSKLYKVQVISSKTLVGLQEGGKPDYRFTFCIKR